MSVYISRQPTRQELELEIYIINILAMILAYQLYLELVFLQAKYAAMCEPKQESK